ncbi:MAG: hypothetical protein L3J09_03160 [Flavobacteriaceae bacterium]|nr:hypothetical protein [Flavobacteriaceae bacterium]
MNKLTTIAFVLLSITISTSQQSIKSFANIATVQPQNFTEFTINDSEYTLHFELEETKDNEQFLIILVEFHNNSEFISPFEDKEFKGKFNLSLGTTNHINFEGDIIETPQAVDAYDKFGHQFVKWVKVNTIYRQRLTIKTKEDFKVLGRLQFTIEPRCTLEQIPFSISYKDGKMEFVDSKC